MVIYEILYLEYLTHVYNISVREYFVKNHVFKYNKWINN